jgi:hypothetical protein
LPESGDDVDLLSGDLKRGWIPDWSSGDMGETGLISGEDGVWLLTTITWLPNDWL